MLNAFLRIGCENEIEPILEVQQIKEQINGQNKEKIRQRFLTHLYEKRQETVDWKKRRELPEERNLRTAMNKSE